MTHSYQQIIGKLHAFTKKYYTKLLVQGILLFIAFGLLFWLVITSLELLLWMPTSWRFVLFFLFVLVEGFLVYRFIGIPLFYLFKLKKGLSLKEASTLIGKHFPEVGDKLFNLLELAESPETSELLKASIAQRSESLRVVPFMDAIDFKDTKQYVKYLVLPLVILCVFWISGNIESLFNSHKRVVNYDLAFERPSPFSFRLMNENLTVLDNEPLVIEFAVEGDLVPENVSLILENQALLMRRNGNRFSYVLQPPLEDEASFYVTANGWNSRSYEIESIRTPSLLDFKMKLDYPDYLNKMNEEVSGSGNAIVPEGTQIHWIITGNAIDAIAMDTRDTTLYFKDDKSKFSSEKKVFNDLQYTIRTSNAKVKDFESLEYTLDVIKDASPKIEVLQVLDSLNPNQSFFTGQLSDDYGLSQLRLVYYPSDNEEDKSFVVLENPQGNVHQFYYTFPSGVNIETDKMYTLFFEVVDNDGLRKGKITKSKTFITSILGNKELKNKELEVQNKLVRDFDKSIKEYNAQKEALDKINQSQKERKSFDFEEKNKVKDFIEKQKEQERLMEKFANQLKESLDKNEDSEQNRLLKERLERQELEAKKNERLLEELERVSDKINEEELKKKLEDISKKQSSNARNLEQLLELTKRYYVNEKMSQLSKEFSELSKEQDKLAEKENEQESNKQEKAIEEQKELNDTFKELSDELDELKKDNKDLKQPFELDVDKKEQQAIKNDQQDALDELQEEQTSEEKNGKQKNQGAKQKQKSAAQKLEELSQSLQQSAAGGGSSDTEDAEMLRQILDNLVTFSFKQEQLFEWVEQSDIDVSQYGKMVRDQKELENLFEHVDDSLFSLSLRRPELSEFVNEQIGEVYYNIEKSLKSLADNQVFQGASYQQYVINATNALSDFLVNILDNMQKNMQPGQGQGNGDPGFQLPDIIQQQQSIQEKLNKSGNQPKPGSESKEGQKESEEGNQPKEGKQKGEQSKGSEQNGKGSNGNGNEEELSEVYEIYKQQQRIRQLLEEQLQNLLKKEDRELTQKLLKQIEDFENDLIENGITQRTRDKVNTIQHELIKLKDATLKQGKLKERESNTNQQPFTNPIISKPEQLKGNDNDIEILNRQALPLRRKYDKRVKVYFNND